MNPDRMSSIRHPLRRSVVCAGAITLAATTGLAILSAPGSAFAAGNGSTTETQHAKGDQTQGLVVLDFNPSDSPPLPADCWANPDLVIVSTTGNAVEHDTVNKAGDFWFTTTYAGEAAVYLTTDVGYDSDGNAVVDPNAQPLYVGHLTTWFGMNDNNKNSNSTVTASFHGTSTSDSSQTVSLNGGMHYTMNANGDTTVTNAQATC